MRWVYSKSGVFLHVTIVELHHHYIIKLFETVSCIIGCGYSISIHSSNLANALA